MNQLYKLQNTFKVDLWLFQISQGKIFFSLQELNYWKMERENRSVVHRCVQAEERFLWFLWLIFLLCFVVFFVFLINAGLSAWNWTLTCFQFVVWEFSE